MPKFDDLDKLIATDVETYITSQLDSEYTIDTRNYVTESLDAWHEPARLFFEGVVTKDEFVTLVNNEVNNVGMNILANQAVTAEKASNISAHVAKIITDATSEHFQCDIKMDVEPNEPWPRK